MRKYFKSVAFQEEIRISHKGKDPEKPQIGAIDLWHHVGCFIKRRKELTWKDEDFTIDMITGFKAMDSKDRTALKALFAKRMLV